jgi:pimeloyl-ACP methyl ester carboxylesterase
MPSGGGVPEQQATIRGVPMSWGEQGGGFSVVLIHGIPTSPALWRHVLPRVSGGAAGPEMVGYRDSIPAGRDRDISVAAQADYLLGWLDHLGVEQAVLVGHDLGGGVAQIAAVRQPRRCAGLVLANAVCYDSWPIPSVRALRAAGLETGRLPMPAFRAPVGSLLAHGHDPATARESLAVHLEPYRRHGGAAALAWQVRWLRAHDTLQVADWLRELEMPARVAWGAGDPFQRLPYGQRLAWDLRTELWRIEGGRHFVPEGHPERLADAVEEVLGAVGAG